MKMKVVRAKMILVFLCAVLLLRGVVLVPAVAAGTQAVGDDLFYCRGALATLNNSTALLYAYDQIVAGVAVSAPEIDVYDDRHPISRDELRVVFDAYRRDHTEHFWIGSSYALSYTEKTVLSIKPEYTLEGAALEQAKALFEQVLSNTVEQIEGMQSEYEIVKYLHDRLAIAVTYQQGLHAHDAFGALVEGIAVCEGYAEALQCLLHRAGIQSLIVLGESKNPSTGIPEKHAWNMVRVNGNYYHIDLTWNDQDSTLFYAYFLQTDAVIKEDHSIDATAYALPLCTSVTDNYFFKNGRMIGSGYTVDSVAEILKGNGLSVSVYVTGDVKPFLEWYYQNIATIAQKAGVSGRFSYGYSQMGRELLLYIDTCKHTALTAMPANPVSCTADGNVAYYTCTCGKWFADAQATEEITNRDSVKILSIGHQWTLAIEDEAHLRLRAEDCRSYSSYWFGCEVCNGISDEKYFESAQSGAHSYGTAWETGDANGHWHKCTECDAHDTPEAHLPGAPATTASPQLCTVCGYEIAPIIHVHSLREVARVDATCNQKGKERYYVCTCGEAFEDAEGTMAIPNLEAWGNTPQLSHTDEDGDGVCDVCQGVAGMFGFPITKQQLIYVAVGGGVVLLLIIIVAASKR